MELLRQPGWEALVVGGVVVILIVMAGVSRLSCEQAAPVVLSEVQSDQPSPSESDTIVVHVAGAVARPGVYTLLPGDRVADAVRRAGGPTDDAELDRVNLAAFITDGQRIHIPGPDEDGGSSTVNLNYAGQRELESLPGIGPALAGRIIDYRERNGPFSSIDELLGVPGIGPSTLERLRELVSLF